MAKKVKVGTITKEQQLTADRKTRREQEIEDNMNVSHSRVHKSEKNKLHRNRKHKGREI